VTGHAEAAAAREGVALDVGCGVGAVVVLTGSDLSGREVEISRAGEVSPIAHTVVHERSVGSTTVHAAVFVDLAEGPYDLWCPSGSPERLRVGSGEIATVDWRR